MLARHNDTLVWRAPAARDCARFDAKVSVDTIVQLFALPARGVILTMFQRQPDSRPSRSNKMSELYPLGAVSPSGSLRIAEAHNSSSYLNRSLRSVASVSVRVGHLVKQAMNCFETDRKAAWRCLNDASTLLGTDVQDLGVNAPSADKPRPGGLAAWQTRRTLAHIEANLASKMEIDDLANLVALSRSHFSRAFKRSLGFSPMEYVVVRRVERAKGMISGTREPLAEVALACGFADQAHLNRRFRDVVGISPGRWRRSNAVVAAPLCSTAPGSTAPGRAAQPFRPQTTTALRGRPSPEVGRRVFA